MKSNSLLRRTRIGQLAVEVYPNRAALGLAAARAAAAYLRDVIRTEGEAQVIFACAPSQNEFLGALADPAKTGFAVDWSRVTAFHMDEYVGLPAGAPQSFRHYLRRHFLVRVQPGCFHGLEADASDSAAACTRYARLLGEKPIDLVCLGIGENGHLAFNDPPVADFNDQKLVKKVSLDGACRQQQVNDRCFRSLDAVPLKALTLTIPVFRRARRLSAHVQGFRKAAAVRAALCGEINTSCPASILRTHRTATLYLDPPAAKLAFSAAHLHR